MAKYSKNSQNKLVCAQSEWVLDADREFLTEMPLVASDCPEYVEEHEPDWRAGDPGELQNYYTTVHSNMLDIWRMIADDQSRGPGWPRFWPFAWTSEENNEGQPSDSYPFGGTLGSPGLGALYARRHTLSSIYSFTNATGIVVPQTLTPYLDLLSGSADNGKYAPQRLLVSDPFGLSSTGSYPVGNPQLYGGSALWEVERLADCAGKYIVIDDFPPPPVQQGLPGGPIPYHVYQGSEAGLKFKVSPSYNTYADYNEVLRTRNKDYSIIPEFRISEWLPYYLFEKGGDFLAVNPGEFEIIGITGSGKTWISGKQNRAIEVESRDIKNSSQNNFYKTFSNSDFMKHYKKLRADHEDFVPPTTITLTCKALLQLLPYDGFFPSERTAQIARLMSQSFGSNVSVNIDAPMEDYFSGSQGSDTFAFSRRPFYSTLFSPGILFNSIKSGMAVDYPVYTDTFGITQYQGQDSIWSPPDPGNNFNYRTYLFALGTGSGGEKGFDYRVPFEALVEPESYLTNLNIWDMEPQPDATYNYGLLNPDAIVTHGPDAPLGYPMNPTNIWTSLQNNWNGVLNDNLYKLAINNFLAETPEFFLKDEEFSKITSTTSNKFGSVKQGVRYAMRVKLRRTLDRARSWETALKLYDGESIIDYALPQDPIALNGACRPMYGTGACPPAVPGSLLCPEFTHPTKENFTLYSRPSAFGPPVSCTASFLEIGASLAKSGDPLTRVLTNFANCKRPSDSITGFYCPFTPPYKDGEAWADIVFDAPRDGQPSIDELRDNSMTILWRIDTVIQGSTNEPPYNSAGIAADSSLASSQGYTRQNAIWNATCRIAVNSASKDPSEYDERHPLDAFSANSHAMQIDASLNLFGFKDNRWIIEPKYETPHYNFNHIQSGVGYTSSLIPTNLLALGWTLGQFVPPDENTLSLPYYASESVPRGMWHQFGKIEGKKGIYMEVDDIPTSWWENRATYFKEEAGGAEFNPSLVRYGVPYKSGFFTPYGTASCPAQYYAAPPANYFGGDNPSPFPESLADILNMKQSVKLGNTASRKIISEALVAVPFLIKDSERKFFKIPEETIRIATGNLGKTSAASEARAAAAAATQAALDALESFVENDVISATQQTRAAAEAAGSATSNMLTLRENVMPHKTILDMVNKMKKYIFPPRMDFVKYLGNIEPFAMYIFEFEYELSQCDLSKIWQNVLPEIGQKVVEQEVSLSHQLLSNQLMGDFKGVGQESMKDEVQWMVFKVKKRGNNNYFSKVTKLHEDLHKTRQHDYSYNWPYDYFSLVEGVKMEVTVGFGTENDENIDAVTFDQHGGSDLLNKGIRSTKRLTDPFDQRRAKTNKQSSSERSDEQREKRKEKRQKEDREGPFGGLKKK